MGERGKKEWREGAERRDERARKTMDKRKSVMEWGKERRGGVGGRERIEREEKREGMKKGLRYPFG